MTERCRRSKPPLKKWRFLQQPEHFHLQPEHVWCPDVFDVETVKHLKKRRWNVSSCTVRNISELLPPRTWTWFSRAELQHNCTAIQEVLTQVKHKERLQLKLSGPLNVSHPASSSTGKRLNQISITTQLLVQIHHVLRLGHTTTGNKHAVVKAP